MKRNSQLRTLALECVYGIQNTDSKTAHRVTKDALKELQVKEKECADYLGLLFGKKAVLATSFENSANSKRLARE